MEQFATLLATADEYQDKTEFAIDVTHLQRWESLRAVSAPIHKKQ